MHPLYLARTHTDLRQFTTPVRDCYAGFITAETFQKIINLKF